MFKKNLLCYEENVWPDFNQEVFFYGKCLAWKFDKLHTTYHFIIMLLIAFEVYRTENKMLLYKKQEKQMKIV